MSDRGVAHFGERHGGEGPAPRFAQWNEVIEALLGHRSVRRYCPQVRGGKISMPEKSCVPCNSHD
ncbi:hypothetical protein WMF11_16795 [Sorangium sp. So ce295]|uniref:hypothetical protein n=1 Tax=Sorangium sp. So ce295 TaxID=3133295 RepID=UPI003F5DAF21